MTKYDGEKHDNDNHYDWAFCFLAIARTKDTEGIYLGTDTRPTSGPNSRPVKAWDKRAAVAAADLIAAVEKTQFVHLRGIETDPRAMWETLELFHATGQAINDDLSTWNEFHAARYTDYTRIALKTHIGYILEISERLGKLHADPPSDKQIISRILSSLPTPEFDAAIRFISSHSSRSDRTFVVGHLLKEEFIIRRGGGLGGLLDGSTPSVPDSAHAFQATTSNPNTPAPVVQVECSNCKRKGHVLEDCFQRGGPKEGQIPPWYYRREPGPPQALFAHTFAM
ncbi:hypothetical protein C8R43DRAFT_1152409 [Mycena crocata]|nr:hypothetical protein C8R43DRAFT_1152409 [Mycena crocata]